MGLFPKCGFRKDSYPSIYYYVIIAKSDAKESLSYTGYTFLYFGLLMEYNTNLKLYESSKTFKRKA